MGFQWEYDIINIYQWIDFFFAEIFSTSWVAKLVWNFNFSRVDGMDTPTVRCVYKSRYNWLGGAQAHLVGRVDFK